MLYQLSYVREGSNDTVRRARARPPIAAQAQARLAQRLRGFGWRVALTSTSGPFFWEPARAKPPILRAAARRTRSSRSGIQAGGDDEEVRLVSVQAKIPCGIDGLLRENDPCIDIAIAHGPGLRELAEEQATRGGADGAERLDRGWACGRGRPSRDSERKCEHEQTERWDSDRFHHRESLPRRRNRTPVTPDRGNLPIERLLESVFRSYRAARGACRKLASGRG
jgi:hypothetical protein